MEQLDGTSSSEEAEMELSPGPVSFESTSDCEDQLSLAPSEVLEDILSSSPTKAQPDMLQAAHQAFLCNDLASHDTLTASQKYDILTSKLKYILSMLRRGVANINGRSVLNGLDT